MTDTTTPTPGAELPVVAWFASGELFQTREAIPGRLLPPAGTLAALTERDTAQSALAALQAENARLRDEAEQVRRAWLGHRDTGHLSLMEAAEKTVGALHDEVQRLTDDRDSWRGQADARTAEALKFADELTAEATSRAEFEAEMSRIGYTGDPFGEAWTVWQAARRTPIASDDARDAARWRAVRDATGSLASSAKYAVSAATAAEADRIADAIAAARVPSTIAQEAP